MLNIVESKRVRLVSARTLHRDFRLLAGLVIAFLGVLMIASPDARGQAVNATLVGTVMDTSGGAVAAVKVQIKEVNTGTARIAETNESGNYVFADLPPGQYQVIAEKPGFKKVVRDAVDVVVNTTVRVDLKIEPGTITEIVEVSAETPILQTDRADVGRKIESKQVVDLPLGNNRNFQNLVTLVPGTVRPHREHSEFFNPQDSLSTEVNGQSRLFNDLKIEGVDDNHRTGLLQVYVPPAEAIQTVDVTTGNYAAEFGRAGGAVTNVVLKSGTNDFHGAAYEFNRVSALAARSYFNRAPGFFPRTTYNYYGGNAGGPIIKNKLFFFGDILRIDDSRGKFDRLTLPTGAFRAGDFRSAGVNIYDPYQTTDATHQTLVRDANGNPIPVAPASRTQFPNNVIPSNRTTPLAQKILALVPPTNLAGATRNYQATTRFLKNTTAFDTKFDFNRTDNDRLAFRFSRAVESINDQPIFGAAGGPKGGGFEGTGEQHTQSGALNHTHVFSSTLISEARFGISHYRNIARNADYGTNASDALGIRGVNLDPFTSGMTAIDIQGGFSSPMIGYSASMPWDRGETNINGVTNWTKIQGNHTFKWGADIRRLRDDLVQAQTFGPRGVFRFGTGTTSISGSKTGPGNNFAAFLIDAPTEVGRDISVISGSWRETELFSYGQDKWQLTSKLTIDAGLRWELYIPASPHHPGGFSNYDPTNNSLVLAGIGGNAMDLGRETSYRYFAPRFGVAFRLTEKTVFRGGFGISYEPFPNNQYAWNFPVRQNNASKQTGSFAIPTFTTNGPPANMANGFPAPAPEAIPPNGILVLPDPRVPGTDPLRTHANETFNVIDKKFRQPYVESWNVAIQRALPKNFVLEVAYVGNHGVRIPMTYNLNAAIAPGVDATGNLLADTCAVRPLCQSKVPGGPGFGRTGNTDFLFKPTTSNYNALQVKLDHRWASGFLLTTSYTYGKALAYRSDQGSDGGSPHFYLDIVNGLTTQSFRRNYSVTSQDRRHTFVQSYIYELPFGKGKPLLKSGWGSWVAGGWQVSGILTFMTGRPLRFTADGKSLNAPGTTQTPIQNAPFRVLGGRDNDLWFDTSAFCPVGVNPPPAGCPFAGNGLMGNMGHYVFAGPHFFNLDASVFRRFPLRERVGLEFRAEAFSVTNTPQFDVSTDGGGNLVDFNNPDFGHVRRVFGGNRSMELGAKITF